MKTILSKIIGCSLVLTGVAHGQEFTPNGSIGLTQTFYGNAGSYKTKTSHPSLVLDYNFTPDWNLVLQWDRTWNMYNYTGEEKQQNNSFSGPKGILSYNHGLLGQSKIKWNSSITIENETEFNGTNQTYSLVQTALDFSEYIPKGEYIQATQFAISPMYIYGWNGKGASGHVNTGALSLLTNWQLPANFSFTLNAYAFREWYDGTFQLNNNSHTYENANYFMVMAWLNYTDELYQFNEDTTLTFNFIGGFDPYISSNRNASWDPYLSGNQMNEWLGPTVTDGNYKNTYALFALPQLMLSYNYDKALSFTTFAQVKYSNQVWGATEKDWRLQPQGGVSATYNF